jgi:hypothetical protein
VVLIRSQQVTLLQVVLIRSQQVTLLQVVLQFKL